MPARLAAVVLNYRTPNATIAAVQALARSSRPIDHVVVVDNGSGDASVAILRQRLPRETLLESTSNLGFSGGVNVGIRHALAEGATLVLLVNSDLTVQPDSVGTLERALADNARAGIAGPMIVSCTDPPRVESSGIRFSRLTGRMRHQSFNEAIGGRQTDEDRIVDGVSGAAMLIRAEVFDRIGLFDDRYFFSFEDLDFCCRAAQAGFITLSVSRAIVRHEGSHTIGARSASRLRFAMRNHLLLLTSPYARIPAVLVPFRTLSVLALNIAYAVRRTDIPAAPKIRAIVSGALDHFRRRYGDFRCPGNGG